MHACKVIKNKKLCFSPYIQSSESKFSKDQAFSDLKICSDVKNYNKQLKIPWKKIDLDKKKAFAVNGSAVT